MTDLEPPKTLGEFVLELDSVGSWLVATALAGLFVGVPLLLIRNAIERGKIVVAVSLALAVLMFVLAVGRDLYRRELTRSSAVALLVWLAVVFGGGRWLS